MLKVAKNLRSCYFLLILFEFERSFKQFILMNQDLLGDLNKTNRLSIANLDSERGNGFSSFQVPLSRGCPGPQL